MVAYLTIDFWNDGVHVHQEFEIPDPIIVEKVCIVNKDRLVLAEQHYKLELSRYDRLIPPHRP